MGSEIKFRVWNDEKMIYRNPIMSFFEFMVTPDGNVFIHGEPGYVNGKNGKAILLRYTGLKDKNGKEIYEGDIVNGYSFNGSTYALGSVVWWTGGWWVEPLQSIEGSTELYGEHIHAEVIGNIYQNPELIQKV